MHVLMVHQNYPAQFGILAAELMRRYGWKVTYLTKWEGKTDALPMIKFKNAGGTTDKVHFLARNFDTCSRAAVGAWQAVREAGLKDVDVVLGHSGFGSTLLLGDLLGCPVVNLFEYFYRPESTENSFRTDYPAEAEYVRRIRVLNATILLDLEQAVAGYTPTHYQRNQFPSEYLHKIESIFDGIDDRLFKRRKSTPRVIAGRTIPDDVKIVTYVSRGFEAMRGYDIFIRAAKLVYAQYPKVLFVVVGSDRVCYGGDLRYVEAKSFREHVDKVEKPDASKFLYPGVIPTGELAKLLSLSDAHVYFTVPFVLSWSMFNAMSCSCRIVSCKVPPVEEVVVNGESALLAPFFDVEGHAANLLQILRGGSEYDALGNRARATIERRYSLNRTVPRIARLLERASGRRHEGTLRTISAPPTTVKPAPAVAS